MAWYITLLICLYIVNEVVVSSVSRADYGEVKLFHKPVSYNVDMTVLLNEISRKDKEVSYKLKSALDVYPVWSESDVEFLLKFELTSSQLQTRGKHASAEYMPVKSVWDKYTHSPFYAHWQHGLIQNVYLDPEDIIDIQNFKRSIISLFQLQMVDGESKETDISGTCDIIYETFSMQTIRKIKRNCTAPGWINSDAVSSRRLTRYSLSSAPDALEELHAEELHELGATLKARVLLRLTRALPAPPAPPRPPSLQAALAAAPPPASLVAPPHALDLDILATDTQSVEQELSEALAEVMALGEGEAGGGGTVRGARAALRLSRAIRRAPPDVLRALLHDRADTQLLETLCGALGAAGSDAAHAVAAGFLRLRAADVAPDLAARYLAAFALAPEPEDKFLGAKINGYRGFTPYDIRDYGYGYPSHNLSKLPEEIKCFFARVYL